MVLLGLVASVAIWYVTPSAWETSRIAWELKAGPDGAALYAVVHDGATSTLEVIDPAVRSAPRRILLPGRFSYVVCPLDGDRVLIQDVGGDSGAFLVEAGSEDGDVLRVPLLAEDRLLAAAPDGHVAYVFGDVERVATRLHRAVVRVDLLDGTRRIVAELRPTGAVLSRDGATMFVSEFDGLHRIRLTTGEVAVLSESEGIDLVDVSPDGRYVITEEGSDRLVVRDAATGAEIASVLVEAIGAGSAVAATTRVYFIERGTVKMLEARPGAVPRVVSTEGHFTTLALGPGDVLYGSGTDEHADSRVLRIDVP